MQVSKNFVLQEFIYPKLYYIWGNKAIYWVAKRRIDTAQLLRDLLSGAHVTINNWHKDGTYRHSGLRAFDDEVGATMSQHKFNSADDLKSPGMSGWDLHEIVVKHWDKFRATGLTTIEHPDHTPNWLHADGRNVSGVWDLRDGPYMVYP